MPWRTAHKCGGRFAATPGVGPPHASSPQTVESSALRTIARNPERAADQVQALEAAAEGDKFLAVKPWVATAASTEPSYPPPLDATCAAAAARGGEGEGAPFSPAISVPPAP